MMRCLTRISEAREEDTISVVSRAAKQPAKHGKLSVSFRRVVDALLSGEDARADPDPALLQRRVMELAAAVDNASRGTPQKAPGKAAPGGLRCHQLRTGWRGQGNASFFMLSLS